MAKAHHFLGDPPKDEPGGMSAEQFERLEQLLMPGYLASKIALASYERMGYGIDTNGDVVFPREPADPAKPEPIDGGQSGDETRAPPIRGDEGG